MAKKEIRFCVGSLEGPCSSAWKIWVNKSDVYIQPKLMAKSCKVSLHESGVFQWSALSEWMGTNPNFNDGNRHIARWSLIEPLGRTACHVFRIIIPSSELGEIKHLKSSKITWLEPPSSSQSIFIDCFLTKKSTPCSMHKTPEHLLFNFELSDNRLLLGVTSILQTTNNDLEQLKFMKSYWRDSGIKVEPGFRGVARVESELGVTGMVEFIPESVV